MPQLNTLVLTDAQTPPVDHTFKPRGTDGGVTTLVESAGVPLGEQRITFSQNRNNNGRIRVIAKIAVPVVQDATVNGVTRPTVVRQQYADITFNFDASSSSTERASLMNYVSDMFAGDQTMIKGYVVDLEGMY